MKLEMNRKKFVISLCVWGLFVTAFCVVAFLFNTNDYLFLGTIALLVIALEEIMRLRCKNMGLSWWFGGVTLLTSFFILFPCLALYMTGSEMISLILSYGFMAVLFVPVLAGLGLLSLKEIKHKNTWETVGVTLLVLSFLGVILSIVIPIGKLRAYAVADFQNDEINELLRADRKEAEETQARLIEAIVEANAEAEEVGVNMEFETQIENAENIALESVNAENADLGNSTLENVGVDGAKTGLGVLKTEHPENTVIENIK